MIYLLVAAAFAVSFTMSRGVYVLTSECTLAGNDCAGDLHTRDPVVIVL